MLETTRSNGKAMTGRALSKRSRPPTCDVTAYMDVNCRCPLPRKRVQTPPDLQPPAETETRVRCCGWLEHGALKLVGGCVIEILGALGACCSGIALETFVDKSAPSSAHVAIAFDVMRKPSKIQSRQLVSPSTLTPVGPSQCSSP